MVAVCGITLVERSDGMSRAIRGTICSSPADYFRDSAREVTRKKTDDIPLRHLLIRDSIHERAETLKHMGSTSPAVEPRSRRNLEAEGEMRSSEDSQALTLRLLRPPGLERHVAIDTHSTAKNGRMSWENPLLKALLIPLRLRIQARYTSFIYQQGTSVSLIPCEGDPYV